MINLLSWRKELQIQQRRQFINYSLLTLLLAIICILIWHCNLVRKMHLIKTAKTTMQHQILQNDQLLQNINPSNISSTQETTQFRQAQKIQQQVFQLLQNIDANLPKDLYLTQIHLTNNEITLTGKTSALLNWVQFCRQLQSNNKNYCNNLQSINYQNSEYEFVMCLNLTHA